MTTDAIKLSPEEWLIDFDDDDPRHLGYGDALLSLANGYLGLRGCADPDRDLGQDPGFYAADVYDDGVDVLRELVNLPHPGGIRVREGFEYLRRGRQAHRILDMRQGLVYERRALRSVDGRAFQLSTVSLLHATEPRLGAVFGTLTAPSDCGQLAIDVFWDNSATNPYLGGALPWLHSRHVLSGSVTSAGGFSLMECSLTGSGSTVSLLSRVSGSPTARAIDFQEHSRWGRTLVLDAGACRAGFNLIFAVDSTSGGRDPSGRPPVDADLDELFAQHRLEWLRRWAEHDIVIERDAHAQQAIRYALFHLMQQELPARPCKLSAARGLSSSFHSGSCFFDTELHKDAYWTWNDPEVVRSHLAYRHAFLPQARALARASGHLGARFPVAADDLGQDSGPFERHRLGRRERMSEANVRQVVHVSADIAFAVDRYRAVVGDDDFVLDAGLELLIETARFSASCFAWSADSGRYETTGCMGPDEYHPGVDNNLFTNSMLAWNLRATLAAIAELHHVDPARVDLLRRRLRLSESELEQWRAIQTRVYTAPPVNALVPAQHDGYHLLPDCAPRQDPGDPRPRLSEPEATQLAASGAVSSRLIKQADVVLLLHLLPDQFSEQSAAAILDYYEPRTAHASSLSFAPHGVAAARLGRTAQAERFFLRAARYNLDFTPRADYRNGLHLSAYAGAWQILVEGMLGARAVGERLDLDVQLPGQWGTVSVPLRFRGRRLLIRAHATQAEVFDLDRQPPDLAAISQPAEPPTVNGPAQRRTRERLRE